MRIVIDGIIFQKDPYGGIARLYRELLPRLCELDPDLSITLFFDGPLTSQIPQHTQIKLKKAPSVRRLIRPQGALRRLLFPFRRAAGRAWSSIRQLWIGEGRGQIWHSTFYTYQSGWKGREVVTVHDMASELYPELFSDPMDAVGREQKKRCIERAAAIICDTQATLDELERIYPENIPIRRIIHLSHSPTFRVLSVERTGWQDHNESLFILYVGSRLHYKNFNALLRAYAGWEKRSGVDLVVVGQPWTREENETLSALGVSRQVSLFSDVDDDELCRMYNRAAALVFPSTVEGFGLPLVEAMACACPIVASRIPSTMEVAGDCPYYFDLDDQASLVSALDQALHGGWGSPHVLKGLQRAAGFSWERAARETLEVYRQVQEKR